MSNDDMYLGTDIWTANPAAQPARLPVPKVKSLLGAEDRHRLAPRPVAYANASTTAAVAEVEAELNKLRTGLKGFSDKFVELDMTTTRMVAALRAPDGELAEARDTIAALEKRVGALIKEAQRQKRRAERAEITPEEIEASKPGEVAFLRRTPGDAIRYLAAEVMKHAEADVNAFLMGAAMGLRMIADDVDRLPQG
ncbi:hypothetical protein QFZ75_007931 [Streptomyces sp. V3I8]|uniref:hypothetical protein n=1 Tax=Streptomyces sp. V3I8 TaxID=3042279 RepID=UPI00278A885F|nr:hypothetical protein [Streptomyces sp. V3I8]MDQ1041429.1 hypothetical protein [Streptomyces sp. V3I8]